MSLLRRRLESLSRTIPTMKTKRAKTLNDRQRAKAARTVRDVVDEVAEDVVEAATMLPNLCALKNVRRPAHDVRRVMKTTWTTMMTIWPLTMSI